MKYAIMFAPVTILSGILLLSREAIGFTAPRPVHLQSSLLRMTTAKDQEIETMCLENLVDFCEDEVLECSWEDRAALQEWTEEHGNKLVEQASELKAFEDKEQQATSEK
jgi:hypothetical protein